MSEVESYFGPIEENGNTNYIPPDYSDEGKVEEEETDFDDDPTEEDEGILEAIENEIRNEETKPEPRKEMISTPFSESSGSSPWGSSGSSSTPSSPWSQQNSGSSIWQQNRPSWGSSSPSWGSSFGGSGTGGNQKEQIPRQKKVVFCCH